MNQEIKAKWVEALRSGRYKQGRGVLRQGNEFCCLGVLADIMDGTVPLGQAFINPALCHRADLDPNDQDQLVALNDSEREPFDVIADYIERTL